MHSKFSQSIHGNFSDKTNISKYSSSLNIQNKKDFTILIKVMMFLNNVSQ